MITSRNINTIKDENGVNDLELEVNFDKANRNLIKVTIGDKIAVIDRQKLWEFVFVIVKPEQQADMLPRLKTEMVKYVKQHQIVLQKDMKAGEILMANCHVDVREEVAKAMEREIEEEKKLKSPYVPQ